jgi:hypothetical protein
MVLEARVGRRWLLVKRIQVDAFCTRTKQRVQDPFVGCGHCHEPDWREAFDGTGTAPQD